MFYKNPDTGEYDLHREGFERLFALVPLKPGDHVLDAGCGSGVLVPYALERIGPAGFLYEVDFAGKMIEVNRRIHTNENIRFIVSDVAEAPLDNESCDAVLCFAAFPHFQDKEKAMRAMSQALKRGGVFVLAHLGILRRPARSIMHPRPP
jgi:demethylmenaquinone methyltransferase/2-methoxy-6-polyprenyl-1,4-benzoquinol methylase